MLQDEKLVEVDEVKLAEVSGGKGGINWGRVGRCALSAAGGAGQAYFDSGAGTLGPAVTGVAMAAGAASGLFMC